VAQQNPVPLANGGLSRALTRVALAGQVDAQEEIIIGLRSSPRARRLAEAAKAPAKNAEPGQEPLGQLYARGQTPQRFQRHDARFAQLVNRARAGTLRQIVSRKPERPNYLGVRHTINSCVEDVLAVPPYGDCGCWRNAWACRAAAAPGAAAGGD